ncbi:MAG: DNA cytosine methyltransferase [Desulfurococcus sp.]|uniref:DNA cytosine methyltransferase n=1 Tax=Desulfurococcus sp. TaxID=51678 RepID=UPI0031619FC7
MTGVAVRNIDYGSVKLRAWSFIERFDGRTDLSLGDARAYLSALVDIIILEKGYDYLAALAEAVRHAEDIYSSRGYGGIAEDYSRVYNRWLEIDRSRLAASKYLSVLPQLRQERDRVGEELTVVSLFTGAYGLDLGFELAGFKVTVALDISEDSYRNLKANRPKIPFLLGDIKRLSTTDILKEAGLRPGEVDVITGGPPCQPFSPAGRRQSLKDPRAAPLVDFIRVIKEARPKVFVMEEVPGILSARIRHVPIKERGKRPLTPEEMPGSAWKVVIEELEKTGYRIAWKVLNAADYGTPQVRERVIVIGVRPDLKRPPAFPEPTHSKSSAGLFRALKPWVTLAEALVGIEDHIGFTPLPPKYAKYMRYVPPGGNWRHIPDELKPEAMNAAYKAGGGRMGFYRRLTWFEPSPTLVTSPAMKATMMVHPWEDRPLSIREYLRIQGFPDDWKVVVSVQDAYRLFGEAVPVPLAKAIARAVRSGVLDVEAI